MHLGSGVPKIRVHRCRTPCKFVVGRDPLSKSTEGVMKSRLFRVLARAGCFRLLSPGILVCVCHNLSAVRHSVSRKRPPPNLHRSQSFVVVSHVPWKVSCCRVTCCITSMYSLALTILLFLHHLAYFVQQHSNGGAREIGG